MWQLPGGTPGRERLCVGAGSLPPSAMLEGPVTVCAEREHMDGWSGESRTIIETDQLLLAAWDNVHSFSIQQLKQKSSLLCWYPTL